jgi:nickel-dependent lactate racemase
MSIHIQVEYGNTYLQVAVPEGTVEKGMRSAPAPLHGPTVVPAALAAPIASPPLLEIARLKLAKNPQAKAVIVVSDNTRPVPYRGEGGLMVHIIRTLREAGLCDEDITVLIGAGSHRNMEPDECEAMLGLAESGMGNVSVVNHEYEVDEQLLLIGHTRRGSVVKINRQYMEADLKIVTGLVESHFMAGASGGRKGICPGIVGKETLTIFHGAKLLSSKLAADLVLEGNPLNDEALETALMAGCDFLVNVTLDAAKRTTGIFAGDMVEAHRQAVAKIREYVVVEIDQLYDIVLIPAGFVGINHYQAAKAATEAARALRQGGIMIIVSENTDVDPIGGPGYKQALQLLKENGKDKFMEMISAPDWKMVPEQWQVQMWCKVLDVLGSEDHLYYCCLDIPLPDYRILPGHPAMELVADLATGGESKVAQMERMVERVIAEAIRRSGKPDPAILFLKDGPYGIPELVNG